MRRRLSGNLKERSLLLATLAVYLSWAGLTFLVPTFWFLVWPYPFNLALQRPIPLDPAGYGMTFLSHALGLLAVLLVASLLEARVESVSQESDFRSQLGNGFLLAIATLTTLTLGAHAIARMMGWPSGE